MTNGWTLQAFNELSNETLYRLLQLRSQVFVLEQACLYQDMDDKDQQALHLCYWQEGRLLGYLRILPAGVSYAECAIGRVVTHPSARAHGLGRELMQRAIDECRQRFPGQSLRIGAQDYLRGFYQSLGFNVVSDVYDEDGIPHVEMVLPLMAQ